MTFNWSDYLSLANTLHDIREEYGCEIAMCRASMSRAYYAAFHEALRLAKSENYDNPWGDEHSKLIEYFKKSKDKTKKSIGNQLERARKLRIDADYRDELGGEPKHQAEITIKYAEKVYAYINSLMS